MRPIFSVIIPTKNEATEILKTLNHLRECSQNYTTEIIVVDGGSSDETILLAKQKADLVLTLPQSNRAAQMHFGATQAHGEIFLFLHADTLLPKNWQNELVFLGQLPIGNCPKNSKKSSDIVACAFQLGFDSDQTLFRMIEFFTRGRTFFTRIPHGDQGLAVSREPYFAVGGFPSTPLMEEYLLIPKLRRLGRLKMVNEKVKTSSRRYIKNGPLKNVLRNCTLILLFFLGVSPNRLARWYT